MTTITHMDYRIVYFIQLNWEVTYRKLVQGTYPTECPSEDPIEYNIFVLPDSKTLD
jgi:hypothetical protein